MYHIGRVPNNQTHQYHILKIKWHIPLNMFKPFSNFFFAHSKAAFVTVPWVGLRWVIGIFLDHTHFHFVLWILSVSCVCLCYMYTACIFLAALWSPTGKSWPLSSLACDVFLCSWNFPIWYLESGMVLDCIDSWFLPSFYLMYRIPFDTVNITNPLYSDWFSYYIDTVSMGLSLVYFNGS